MFLRRALRVVALACCTLSGASWALGEAWVVHPAGPTGAPVSSVCDRVYVRHDTATLDASGNLYRVGYYHATDPDSSGLHRSGLYAAKYSASSGTELWRFARAAVQTAIAESCLTSVLIDADGNAIVAGYLVQSNVWRTYVAKLSGADGSVLWELLTIPGENAGTMSSTASDMALDAQGNALVIGTRQDSDTAAAWVIKVSHADGTLLWSRTFEGTPDFTTHMGYALALDAAGNPIGVEFGPPQASNLFKLDGATGSVLWSTPMTLAFGNPKPDAMGLTVDALGKATVFGKVVAKYAADGTLDWSHPIAPADATSWAYDAIVAPNGDIIATGSIFSDTRIFTTRLASASGAPVWTATYARNPDTTSTPQNGNSVKLDANGDVLIGGGVYWGVGLEALYVKYDAATGAEKTWQRYPGAGVASNPGQGAAVVVLAYPGAVYENAASFALKYVDTATAPPVQGPPPLAGTMPRKMDFDFDDHADIAWRDGAGHYHFWLMNGVTPWAQSVDQGAGADVRVFGDFNGDAKTDLVLRNPDGSYTLWTVSGHDIQSIGPLLQAGTGWEVIGSARFDADAISDLLWRNNDGSYGIWLLKDPGTGCCTGDPKSAGLVAIPGPGFEVVQIADFNGDGMDDLLWRHPDGRVFVALMNGMTTTSSVQVLNAGTGWTPVLVGDFNGDGKADILWRKDDGSYGVWLMNGTAIASYAAVLGANTGWTATFIGDLDGDGKHDIVWSHTNGSTGAWLMDGTSIKSYGSLQGPGSAWQVVRTDDFDFDGHADLLWHNAATNQYGIWLMNGLSFKAYGGLDEPLSWKAEP